MTMFDREIVNDGTYTIPVTFEEDGAVLDMTAKIGYLRLRLKTSTGAVAYTWDTDTADEFTWTTQTLGTGTWLFKSDDSLVAGAYWAELWVEDSSSPVVRRLGGGKVTYTIKAPDTGAF